MIVTGKRLAAPSHPTTATDLAVAGSPGRRSVIVRVLTCRAAMTADFSTGRRRILRRLNPAQPVIEQPHHLEPLRAAPLAPPPARRSRCNAPSRPAARPGTPPPRPTSPPARPRPALSPSGQYISLGRGPFVPTMMARARLFSSVTGIRLFRSVISSTRALTVHPSSATRPTTPFSSNATWPRVMPLSGPTDSSTARA